MRQPITSAVELLVGASNLLVHEERDEAERRIVLAEDNRRAGEESEGATLLEAMRRFAAHTEGPLTPDAYRQARKELDGHAGRGAADGPSWKLAREALALADAAPSPGKGTASSSHPGFADSRTIAFA